MRRELSVLRAVLSHSVVSDPLWPHVTAAHQAPLSMGFSRQEYWSGLLCPPLGESSRPRDRTQISFCFLFFKFIYFSWRLITLQYCSGFSHTLTWISHGCTCVPHPEPPSHLPPHPIPQGHPSAPALSTLSHASNMFQCYSLKSSHPRLVP